MYRVGLLVLTMSWIAQAAADTNTNRRSVDKIMAAMSTEEKVGQLLMIGFGGTEVNPQIDMWVRERRVGGVALFARNIVNLQQTVRFTQQLQALANDGVPLFLALDQEGGNVIRVKEGAILLPGNMALGATRSPTLAFVSGQALAVDLKLLGFNMNLAPVLDVNSNPKNPVIGVRSYGEKPELVGELGAWYVRGQQEMGVAAVAKHFPGHGDTISDSHYAMPSIHANLQRLTDMELRPFQEAMNAGLDAVMTAHIALPNVAEKKDIPATLSKTVLTDVLRKRMGFDGVVITDGLEMQGIIENYGTGRAAVLAILAGADMPMVLWTPKKKEEVYQSLLTAVRTGEISAERLDESVRRILTVKQRRGLFERKAVVTEDVVRRANKNPLHEQVAARIAREAVTLVRNHGDVLPLRSVRYRKVLVLAPPGPFGEELEREPNVTLLSTAFIPSRERREQDIAKAIAQGKDADLLIVGVVNRYHVDMARRISEALSSVPTTMVSFASPYYLEILPNVDAYVCTYSYLDGAQHAAVDALLGRAPMTGRLPITIPGFYQYGHRADDRFAAGTAPTASVR